MHHRKPDPVWLATEARRIGDDIAAADIVIRAIDAARHEARAIQSRFAGTQARNWRLVELQLEDALIEARAERAELDGSITNEMEDAI